MGQTLWKHLTYEGCPEKKRSRFFTLHGSLKPHASPMGRDCHCSHFIGEETEAQRGSNLLKSRQLGS